MEEKAVTEVRSICFSKGMPGKKNLDSKTGTQLAAI
jgi:hypothetical protein